MIFWAFHGHGGIQNGWFIVEDPKQKWMIAGDITLFQETTTWDKLTPSGTPIQVLTQLCKTNWFSPIKRMDHSHPQAQSVPMTVRSFMRHPHNGIEIETRLPDTHPTLGHTKIQYICPSSSCFMHFGMPYLDEHATNSKLFRNLSYSFYASSLVISTDMKRMPGAQPRHRGLRSRPMV